MEIHKMHLQYESLFSRNGMARNEVRKALHIPLIETNMVATTWPDQVIGNWELCSITPETQIAHIWKLVIGSAGEDGIYSETDAFRKMLPDGRILQLKIFNKVEHGDVTERTGTMGILGDPKPLLIFDDRQVDSVARAWGLNELVRGEK